MAYAYQQNLFEGSSTGYVQYNISPDFGTALSLGETFTISGKMYSRDLKRYGVIVYAGVELGINSAFLKVYREIGRVSKTCNKGGTATFSVTCTITQQLLDLGAERGFRSYIEFTLVDVSDFLGGALTIPKESQRLYTLKSRLPPVINKISFSDSTLGLNRFGAFIQNESLVGVDMEIALDPLDSGLTIAQRTLVFGTNTYNLLADSQSIGFQNYTSTVAYSLFITDSAGKTASTDGTVSFLPYTEPSLIPLTDVDLLQRYEITYDDQGNPQYKIADDGTFVWFNFLLNVCKVANLNAWTLKCTYAEYGQEFPAATILISGNDGTTIRKEQARDLLTSAITFSASKRYSFELTLKDFYNTVTATFDIDKAGGYAMIGKHSVSVGMRGTGTIYNKKFEVAEDYTSHFYGGIGTINVVQYSDLAYADGFGVYEGQEARVSRVGCMVFLEGAITSTKASASSSNEILLATLPEWARPRVRVNQLMQGTSSSLWWLKIDTDGRVIAQRYRTSGSTSYTAIPNGAFLPISANWIAGDSYANDQ